MFSIGEFARHGRVSVRMLRRYDAIGLLRPACVDPATGYRFYQAGQLAELNRIIALKEPLSFDLWQPIASAGVTAAGPAIAYYEDTPAGDGGIVVHAAVPVVTGAGRGARLRRCGSGGGRQRGGHHSPRLNGRCAADRAGSGTVDRRQWVPVRRLRPRGDPGMVR